MKARLHAGAELDFLTKKELGESLAPIYSWMLEMKRGVRSMRFSGTAQVSGGQVVIGDPESPGDRLGPKPGYIWAVSRLTVGGLTTNDTIFVYLNSLGPLSVIHNFPAQSMARFGSNSLILLPDDYLIVGAFGISDAEGTTVQVNGACMEVAQNMAWKLLG